MLCESGSSIYQSPRFLRVSWYSSEEHFVKGALGLCFITQARSQGGPGARTSFKFQSVTLYLLRKFHMRVLFGSCSLLLSQGGTPYISIRGVPCQQFVSGPQISGQSLRNPTY